MGRKKYKFQTPTLNGQSVGNIPIAIRNHKEYSSFLEIRQQNPSKTSKEIIVDNISKSLEMFAASTKKLLDNSVSETTGMSVPILTFE